MRRVKVGGDVASTTTTPETKTDAQGASGEQSTEQRIRDEQNAALARSLAKDKESEPRPGGGSRATHPGSASNVTSTVSSEPHPEDVGEMVSVTLGEELYSPRQFFTFRVGPFRAETKIREGETRVQAYVRVRVELEEMARLERAQKMKVFLDTMEELFGEMKKRGATS